MLRNNKNISFIYLSYYSRLFCSINTSSNTIIKRKPHGYWKDVNNQKLFLQDLAKKLNINHPEDWKIINNQTIRKNGGASFINRYKNITEAFSTVFPDIDWKSIIKEQIKQPKKESNLDSLLLKKKRKTKKERAPGKDLMLSQVWNDSIDPTGYWISEKYDGIRAFWSGSILVSRYGRQLPAPDWFIDKLPKDIPIDGELWAGVNNFGKLIKILKSSANDDWNACTLMAFDSPNENEKFEERIERLHSSVNENTHLKFVPFIKCKGLTHLKEELKKVVDKGGEGLMLRTPEAEYDVGRSYNLLKVKLQQDAEVKMVRKASKCVGYDTLLPNNVMITIRCTFTDYKYPPKPGTVLKVKHFGEWESSGKLKNPYFLGVRNDGTTWEEIVEQYNIDKEYNSKDQIKEN